MDVSQCSYREFLQCTIINALFEFLLSCSITLASLSRLFTIKIDVFAFLQVNSHSGLFP